MHISCHLNVLKEISKHYKSCRPYIVRIQPHQDISLLFAILPSNKKRYCGLGRKHVNPSQPAHYNANINILSLIVFLFHLCYTAQPSFCFTTSFAHNIDYLLLFPTECSTYISIYCHFALVKMATYSHKRHRSSLVKWTSLCQNIILLLPSPAQNLAANSLAASYKLLYL